MTIKMPMRHLRVILEISSACVLLTACSTTQKMEGSPASASAGVESAPAKTSTVVETEVQRQDRMIKSLSGKSIFFDYDNYSVKAQYESVIREGYEFLKSAPTIAVVLQGNADERGSAEYNLALGQKRAEAVKRELKLMGVAEDRMEAVSFGEEKPRANCHEEKCWSDNRRVDLGFSRKP